jgi:hypothetical protein
VPLSTRETLCIAAIDWTQRLVAHGKRAVIVFRRPLPCEVRRVKLGIIKAEIRRDSRCYFLRGSGFEKAQGSGRFNMLEVTASSAGRGLDRQGCSGRLSYR